MKKIQIALMSLFFAITAHCQAMEVQCQMPAKFVLTQRLVDCFKPDIKERSYSIKAFTKHVEGSEIVQKLAGKSVSAAALAQHFTDGTITMYYTYLTQVRKSAGVLRKDEYRAKYRQMVLEALLKDYPAELANVAQAN